MLWKPQKILVENDVAQTAIAESALARWPDTETIRLDRIKDYRGPLDSHDLAIARQRGRFIKKCPGTPAYTCCDYYVLNLGIGCRFE